ncbi:MAG: type III-B CRISPR-associated protein Cas10/Cmr2 [bacterium JZ-2024 1]
MTADLWVKKVVAILHDPPGKALALRDRSHIRHGDLGKTLQSTVLGRESTKEETDLATRADHIASAADRVNFPQGATAYWDQVDPLLTHPLGSGGIPYSLNSVKNLNSWDTEIQEKAVNALWALREDENTQDFKKSYLFIWRLFYEELAKKTAAGSLVHFFPADTRQPDHSLEHHLSVTSAIAGALDKPAFVFFAMGPVQDFITASRRTQDLWMGSWILSYLSWTAMKSLADTYGPDVIVYPSLRAQPLCDGWLSRDYGLPCAPSADALARPTLPNKFLALLPSGEAEEMARNAEQAVREEWKRLADKVCDKLGQGEFLLPDESVKRMWADQIDRHLEVYWVVLPWMEGDLATGQVQAEAVRERYRDLCGPGGGRDFKNIYAVLATKGQYQPNLGTVWSLLYDLGDRAFNARKNLRNFSQMDAKGAKCTLCGVRSALRSQSHDARAFWQKVAQKLSEKGRYDIKPEGKERLCAVCTVKRFVRGEVLDEEFGIKGGFPATTEIAVAVFKKSLIEALKNGKDSVRTALTEFLKTTSGFPQVDANLFPHLRKLVEHLENDEDRKLATNLLALDGEFLIYENWTVEHLAEISPKITEATVRTGCGALKKLCEAVESVPARYYAVLYLDGDQMGRWFSGTHQDLAPLGDILHPHVRDTLKKDPAWTEFLSRKRIITPAVHTAISDAVGQFALRMVPYIVEHRYPGRLLYAGGDDVLAMVPLENALQVARELRFAFSGHIRWDADRNLEVVSSNPDVTGYVEWNGRLFLTMGPKATASAGIVLAHHQHPLDLVLDCARRALKAAKERYGRNAFAVEVLKRSGESLSVGASWYDACLADTVQFLQDIVERLRTEKVSGKWPYTVRAEAAILAALPLEAQKAELYRLLQRQAGESPPREEKQEQANELSGKLVKWAENLGQLLKSQSGPAHDAPGFAEMSQWLLVCSFISRGGAL